MTAEKVSIFAENLRKLRQSRKLKQEDIASRLGVSIPTYSSWERGRTEPSIENLKILARYHGVSVDRLIGFKQALRVGSWYPVIGDFFHPINNVNGIYKLIYSLVFNRLCFYDIYERRFYHELIYSRKADERTSSYIFHLHEDVKFHRGDPLELEDVKYSYDLHLELFPFFKQFIKDIVMIKEEHAIELKMSKWLELEYLPMPYIIPRAYADEDECFEGTGPWRIGRDQRDRLREGLKQPVTMESNNQYFGGMPKIEVIEYHKFNNSTELEKGLKSGKLDVAYDCELEDLDGFDSKIDNSSVPLYLIFDQEKEICRERNVREAVDYALDRDRFVERFGPKRDSHLRILPHQHLYLILRGAVNGENKYDREKARACWEEALTSLSDKGIVKPTLRIGTKWEHDPLGSEVIDEVVKQLTELGIDAEREPNPDEAHALVEIVGFNHPRTVYMGLHSSQQHRRNWKYGSQYVDNRLDDIKSMDTYRGIQDFLTSELVFIPLLRRGVAITYSKSLDTRSKIHVTDSLYGPEAIHWRLDGSN